ncbi:hypothetical protein [Paraburkholderia sp. A3RO-2L]|jgi:hypothetical protein|uniref:hypothetical protein n=1 Tax=unclassified Paraburkholderia TaxID=2615204 RepID=UPI003DA8ED47
MEVASATKIPRSPLVEPVACKSTFSDCLSSYLSQGSYEKKPAPARSRSAIKPEATRKPVTLAAGEAYRPGSLLDIEA